MKATGYVCVGCDSEDFDVVVADLDQEYAGVLLKVRTKAIRCSKCGWTTVGRDQIDELLFRTREAFLRNALTVIAEWSSTQSNDRDYLRSNTNAIHAKALSTLQAYGMDHRRIDQ